ncbi:hypothetical protein ACH4GZ_40370 [Streptomyces hygroscopicus]|uniref:hypothetical protein n=1 Tax=Streptomyces hygroscopicus TaxID=1912 RepID=UPI0037B8AEC8
MVLGVADRVLLQGEQRGDLCGALDGPLLHRAEFDRAVTDEQAAEHHLLGEHGDGGVEPRYGFCGSATGRWPPGLA